MSVVPQLQVAMQVCSALLFLKACHLRFRSGSRGLLGER